MKLILKNQIGDNMSELSIYFCQMKVSAFYVLYFIYETITIKNKTTTKREE